MRTMKMFVASFVLALGMGVAGVRADTPIGCGDTLSEALYSKINKVRSGELKPAEELTNFNAAADACPTNPFALHYAGLVGTHVARVKNQQTPGAQDVFDMWSHAFALNQTFWALDDEDHSFVMADVVGVRLSYEEKRDLREDLLIGLMEFCTKLNRSHPYVAETAPLQACPKSGFTDALAISEWLNNNFDKGEHAIRFLERLDRACEFNKDTRNMHKVISNVRLRYAEHIVETAPANAAALLVKVRAYRDAVLGPGETANYMWSQFRAADLNRVEAAIPERAAIPTDAVSPLVSAGLIPVENWFNGQADQNQVTESIGRTLNAYWVAEDPQGIVRAIGKMYAATKEAADPDAARIQLYNAISKYDRDQYRSTETAEKTFQVSCMNG